MTAAATTLPEAPATPEMVLEASDKLYELVDGVLVEKRVGVKSARVATVLGVRIESWSQAGAGGMAVIEPTIQCFDHQPQMVRRPDVIYLSNDRIPADGLPGGHLKMAPDVVVEVVSPKDRVEPLEQKLRDYLRTDIGEVWLLFPQGGHARVHRGDGSVAAIPEGGTIDGGDLMPGFSVALPELYAA
jgi:Uma2 family endonuclease